MSETVAAEVGHNSRNVNNVSGDRLRNIIERVERLKEEQKGISEDIKDIMAEAKSAGFNPKTIREILRIRTEDAEDRRMREELRDVYLRALDMY